MAMVKREAMLIAHLERYCWSMRPGVLAGCAASTVTQNSFPWQQTAGCCCCCFRPSSEWLKHFHGHNRWTVNNKMWRWTFEYSRRDLKASLFRYSGLICNVNISVRGEMWTLHFLSGSIVKWNSSDLEEEDPCCQQTIGRQTSEKCQYITSHTLQLQLSRVGFFNFYILIMWRIHNNSTFLLLQKSVRLQEIKHKSAV